MINQISLINDVSQVPLLTAWIEAVGEELRLSPTAIFQLNLALEEAVVNVMNYAYPGETGRPVVIEVEKDDAGDGEEHVVFTLMDEGIPFDPTQKTMPDITLPAEDRQIGGLGIFLVEQLMEKVAYERQERKNILKMTYLIKKEIK